MLHILFLKVKNSVWRNELKLRQRDLLELIQNNTGHKIITHIKERYKDFEIDKEYVIKFDDIRWPIARSIYMRSINIPIKDIKSITIDYKIFYDSKRIFRKKFSSFCDLSLS